MLVGGPGAAEETRAVSYHSFIQSPVSDDYNILDQSINHSNDHKSINMHLDSSDILELFGNFTIDNPSIWLIHSKLKCYRLID